ncbi:ParB N-terminal domain-containing protein, partial [bacterium]|nr:ParB N-terminal domain-containing protein [bacterium]
MMNLETPNQETPEQTGGAAVLLLDDIFPHPDNPWDVKPDDEDMSVLKASIEETGLQNPILVRP